MFVVGVRSASGIFWIQPGRGHDGASQFFGGNGRSFGWRWATGIFCGGGRDEAIASSDYGLQVLWLVGVVRQGAADLADRGIDSLFDVDKHIFAPQLARDLLASDQLAPFFDHEHEQLQRQALEPNRAATSAELKAAVIQLEILSGASLILQCITPTPLVASSVRNSVLPGLPCQAGEGEFLQISSDGFRPAAWTFPGIRRKITLTCGICSALLREPAAPGRDGFLHA